MIPFRKIPGRIRRTAQPQELEEGIRLVPGWWTRRGRLAEHPQAITIEEGTGPTKRSFPVFELPDVVLDLDAEDNPHVRPYDESSDGPSQHMKWGHDPTIPGLQEQVSKLRDRIKQDFRAMRARAATPFAPSHISDHDIMKIALFGGSSVSDVLQFEPSRSHPLQKYGSEIRLGLRRAGIPTTILGRPANTVITFMLHRQQLANAALKDKALRRTPNDAEAFRAGLDECRDLHRVSKLCSRIDGPSSVVDVSAELIDHVCGRLLAILQSGYQRSSPENILKFVNNVTIKRLSSGKNLNRSMTLLGLQLASSIGVLACILQYLQMATSMGFINESDEADSLTRLQTGRAILAALERGEGMARGTRQQIFTLLTGRSSGISGPQPSLLGLNAEDQRQRPNTFDLRIRLLGELGAVRLLWHQRHQRHDDEVVSMAILRSAQVLSSLNDDVLGMSFNTATGDVERDAALDLQTMNALDAFHTNRGSKIPKPSLSNFEKYISAQQIKEAFDHPDLSQAMARFREMIGQARAQSKTAARKKAVAEEEAPTSEKDIEKDTQPGK